MQKIRIDFDNPGLPQHISAVENDSQSRFFQATLYENGKAYTAPEGATYSIMYRGFGPQNQGWYDTINDGAGKRAACAVSGNVVTCEIARQALQVPGHVSIVLCVTTGKGYMLKSWPIECDCKNDRYDSTVEIESFFYITQVSNADWTQAIQAWENLKDAIDPTLSLSGKAADAAKVGEAVGQVKEDLADTKKSIQINTNNIYTILTDSGSWESGTINASTGAYQASANAIRTSRILTAKTNSTVSIEEGYKLRIIWLRNNSILTREFDKALDVTGLKYTFTEDSYVQLVLIKTNISLTDAQNVSINFIQGLVTDIISEELNKAVLPKEILRDNTKFSSADEIPANTIFTISTNLISNIPDSGTLITLSTDIVSTVSGTTQILVNRQGKIYTRIIWSGTWTNWNESGGFETYRDFYISMSMFPKVGVIGDSYASGACGESIDATNAPEHKILSWPQIMARRNGIDVTNYAKGGLSTRTWLANNECGLPKLLTDEQKDLYIIALIRNDYNIEKNGESGYLGSISDITNNRLETYPDTFYGNYAKIIERIQAFSPKSKIVLMTGDYGTKLGMQFNDAVEEIAGHYKIPCMVQRNDAFFVSNYYKSKYIGGHPPIKDYAGMELAIERMMQKSVVDNIDYWYDYVGIGYSGEDAPSDNIS